MFDTDGAVFEFKTENDDRLAKDYYNIVNTDIPLFAVKEELLYLMETHKITYFRVPATKTRDHKEYVFNFEIESFEKTKVRKYKYIGCEK